MSVTDIINILHLFYEPERFDHELSHQTNQYRNNNCIVYNSNVIGWRYAFGSIMAMPSRKYYWKLKLVKGCAHFGIIEQEWCAVAMKQNIMWWTKSVGYSYFNGNHNCGVLYHDTQVKFDKNSRRVDTIEIWLDLKRTLTLAYAINGDASSECFKLDRYFFVKANTIYKLAIALHNAEVSMLSFTEE